MRITERVLKTYVEENYQDTPLSQLVDILLGHFGNEHAVMISKFVTSLILDSYKKK